MEALVGYPPLILVIAFVVMWLAAWVGLKVSERAHGLAEGMRADYSVVLGATLTLLGLIIG